MKKSVLSIGSLAGLLFSPFVSAAPVNGTVVAGSASISQNPNGNTTVINQTSSSTVINWQGFNTAPGETVQFSQPNNSAVAVNRITSGLPTQFAGNLTANGQVWILNPAGVVFTQSSAVNVAGLLATTMDIKDEDVMQGNYKFYSVQGFENSQIINNGNINVGEMGVVALVAPNVANGPTGVIYARTGKIALASGTAFTLDFNGDELINFASTQPVQNGHVVNQGQINVEGKSVVWMKANTVSQILDNVIDMSGVIQATSIENNSGRIILSNGFQGTVKISGKIIQDKNGDLITEGQNIDFSQGEVNPGVGGVWIYRLPTITVDSNLADLVNYELSHGVNMALQALDGINVNNIIAQTESVNPVTLWLQAYGDININKSIILYTDGNLGIAGKNININKSDIRTGGAQIYYSPVNITNGLVTLTAGGDMVFKNTLDGADAAELRLVITDAPTSVHKIEFDGEVGSVNAFGDLGVFGNVDIKTDKIITQKSQYYDDKVVLDNQSKVTFQSQEPVGSLFSVISFHDAVTSLGVATDVIINGALTLADDRPYGAKASMGVGQPENIINSLTVTGDMLGGDVVTQDFQDYQGNYYLNSDVNLASINGKIKFRNKIDGWEGKLFNLTIAAPTVEFNGSIGSKNKLNAINIAAQNINMGSPEIDTVGTQNYNGVINLLNNVNLNTENTGIISFDVINGLNNTLRLVSGKGIFGAVHVKGLSLGGTGGSNLINSSVSGRVAADAWNFIGVDRTALGDYFFNGIHDWPLGITPEMNDVIVKSQIFAKPVIDMMNLDLGETDLDPIDTNPSPEKAGADQAVDVNLYAYETCQGADCGQIDMFYKKHPHKAN